VWLLSQQQAPAWPAVPVHLLMDVLPVMQEVEDLDRQLRLMSDTRSAQATADGMRELTITDKGRASMKISAHTIARKVTGKTASCSIAAMYCCCVHACHVIGGNVE